VICQTGRSTLLHDQTDTTVGPDDTRLLPARKNNASEEAGTK
jgi:hypothetical protein